MTLSGPSPLVYEFSSPPAGAVPLTFTVDATNAGAGASVRGTLNLSLAPDTWLAPGRTLSPTFGAYVHDARVDLVRRSQYDGMGARPAGPVYAFLGADLSRIDTATGAGTKLFTAPRLIRKLAVAPDGTVYARLSVSGQLLRSEGGAAPTYIELGSPAEGALAVAPDGTVYTFAGSNLLGVSPAGVVSAIATTAGAVGDMVYHPDGGLYYTRGLVLYRFDLARRVEESRGNLPALSLPDSHVLAVDAQGRLFATRDNALGVHVYDTNANLLARLYVPETTLGVGIVGDRLFGVGTFYSWRSPLP
jgi:hypothetical protein